jgi:Ras-related protein Ral-A
VKNTDSVPFLLIGNKCDLTERRGVERSQADYIARNWRVTYTETSAKTRENVDKAFFDLLRLIRDSKQQTKNLSQTQKQVSPTPVRMEKMTGDRKICFCF